MLFVDNSHRVFMNSDVTAIFLDAFPRLRRGVLVGIHDITLPYDYPAAWSHRYYSEQYLLAAYLLARGDRFEIALPGTFVSDDPEMREILSPLWTKDVMKSVERHGSTFWVKMS